MDNNASNQKVVSDTTEQPNLYDESNSLKEASKRKYSDAEDSVLVGEEKHRKKKKKSKDRDRKRSKDRDDDRKRNKKDSRDRDRSDRDRDRDRHRDRHSRDRDRDRSRDRSSRKDDEKSKQDLNDIKSVKLDNTDKVSLVISSETVASNGVSGKSVAHEPSRDRDQREGDKERDRDRRPSDRSERDRDRDDRDRRDRERDKERERERERDGERAREKDRERDREREARERRRDRSRSPERSKILVGKIREPDRGDRRSYRYDGARGRSNSEDRRGRDGYDKKKEETTGFKPAMLKEIIAANPGISMPEAVVRLNAYNTAVARGMDPGSMSGDIPVYSGPGILPLGMANLPSATLHSITSSLGVNGVASMGIGGGDPLSKPHRELYIGNLPPGITVPQLAEFLNSAMNKLGYSKDTNSVVTAWVSPDGHYAFVEVRTVDEANAALTYLNGIQVGAFAIRIGRPKGYNAAGTGSSLAVPMQGGMSGLQMMNPAMMGTVGLGVSNPLLVGLNNSMIGGMGLGGLAGIGTTEVMSHVIMCSNLPALINEEQIKELFSPFGELKAFNIIRTSGGASQSAVFEYVDPAIVDGVVAGMNKLELGDSKLSVQRIPLSSAAMLLKPNDAPAMIPSAISNPSLYGSAAPSSSSTDALSDYPPSAVIRLLNMTSASDLADDSNYNELLEDVSDECNTHGTVKSIVIPRTSDASNGVIFVFFVNVSDAQKCLKAVAGRRFNGKVVEGTFYPEELFARKVYVLPEDYFVHQQQSQSQSQSHSDSVEEEGEVSESTIGPSGPPSGAVYQSTDDLDTLD